MPTVLRKTEFLQLAGHESEPTSWFLVDQDRVDRFAEATLDRQFIHVDPERAGATRFGGTIAHGFLSLSLLPHLAESVAIVPEGLRMAVNYGLDRVRFPRPVPVGSEIRLRLKVLEVDERRSGQLLVRSEATLEVRGKARPALVAETLALFIVD